LHFPLFFPHVKPLFSLWPLNDIPFQSFLVSFFVFNL
jgi:hypothetical protein